MAKSVKKSKVSKKQQYQIFRTRSSGVFAGYAESRNGTEAVVLNARRLWYWDGAASLSQLAQSGTVCPEKCKFPESVDRVVLTEVIEIDDVTDAAKATIDAVPVWKR
jgi:5-formaminoimidazole-4-carboxamide-1-beta-D-ribofuranosyl 5'-monophosphate synthetase